MTQHELIMGSSIGGTGRYVGFSLIQPYRLFTSLATAPRPPATVANPHTVRSLVSKQTHIQSHSPSIVPPVGSKGKAASQESEVEAS